MNTLGNNYSYTCFFYKQHFYKQRQTEIGKKIKHYQPKIMGDILKDAQKTSASI